MPLRFFQPAAAAAIVFFVFVCGACTGSFINCLEMRVQSGTPLFGRSECPHCGSRLKFYDLIPIASWLVLQGRCRVCRGKISARYILSELLTGLVWGAAAVYSGLTLHTVRYIILFTVLMLESLWDIDTMEVPDALHIVAALNYAVFIPLIGIRRAALGIASALVFGGAVLLLSIAFDRLSGRESLGGADIKLTAVLGLYFGFEKMLLLIILSSLFGLLYAAVSGAGNKKPFPFVLFLSAAAVMTALFGDVIIGRYLGLFGLTG